MKSLRLRLLTTLCIGIVLLWGSVAAWMFSSMRLELMRVLDDRLIASTRMVAGIVQQFSQDQIAQAGQTSPHSDLLSVIARDGVACEVSLVRGEVELLPLARTNNSPGFGAEQPAGFGRMERGGKHWRTYVLEDNHIRITTADRMDVREHLVQSFVYALVLPFVLVLIGLLVLTWWMCNRGLAPLQRLQRSLASRPPLDATPIQEGQDIVELAPMVQSLNALLQRMNVALAHERRWTADAAHELRTPLTAIKTHVQVTELLVQREFSQLHPAGNDVVKQVQSSLAQAIEGIGHMHETLEQLLLLARLEGESALNGECVQGSTAIEAYERACEQSRQHAMHRGYTTALQVQRLPREPQMWHDWCAPLPAALLACAVSNLLDNAFRHHHGDGPVTAAMRLDIPAQKLQVVICNHGSALSANECEMATQRFWRKNPSGPGSGLGLTIVQRISTCTGGTFSLSSDGLGVSAMLEWPIKQI